MRVAALLLLIVLSSPSAYADCSGGSAPTGQPCGAIDHIGCCKSGTVFFCEGGELCSLSCNKIPQCGWDGSKGLYDCETTGGADPDLEYPLECLSNSGGECQGVDYSGCCAGSWVYWCDGKELQGFDCGANKEHSTCGANAVASVADCVLDGAAEYKACPFEAGGVEVPDPVASDVVTGDGNGDGLDVVLSTDGLSVPDIAAPSSCSELSPRYEVSQSDCDALGSVFLVKQEGCAALLVGMAPATGGHPAAKVTKTGLAFSFAQDGLAYNCTGSLAGDSVSGQCFWGNGGECTFAYDAVVAAEPEPAPTESSGGSCSAGGGPRRLHGEFLLLLALLGLAGLRRGMLHRGN
jgi:hypothetical protein